MRQARHHERVEVGEHVVEVPGRGPAATKERRRRCARGRVGVCTGQLADPFPVRGHPVDEVVAEAAELVGVMCSPDIQANLILMGPSLGGIH